MDDHDRLTLKQAPMGEPKAPKPKPIRARRRTQSTLSRHGDGVEALVTGFPRTRHSESWESTAYVSILFEDKSRVHRVEVTFSCEDAERLGMEIAEKARAARETPVRDKRAEHDEQDRRFAERQAAWERFLAAEKAAGVSASPAGEQFTAAPPEEVPPR
jgi:hypothetical protein